MSELILPDKKLVLARSTYSKMLAETEDHATFFSIYAVMEKLSVVIGTLAFGLLEAKYKDSFIKRLAIRKLATNLLR